MSKIKNWLSGVALTDDYTRQNDWYQNNGKSCANSVIEFNYYLVIQYLAKVLSLIENEEYKSIELCLPSSELLINKPFCRKKKPDEENFSLITSSKNMDNIFQAISSKDIEDKDDIEELLDNEKHIILIRESSKINSNYLSQQSLEEIVEKTPCLAEVIKRLIEYRVECPQLSEEQIFYNLFQENTEKYPLSIVYERKIALNKKKN